MGPSAPSLLNIIILGDDPVCDDTLFLTCSMVMSVSNLSSIHVWSFNRLCVRLSLMAGIFQFQISKMQNLSAVRATISGALSFLHKPHFRVDKESGALILYQHERSQELPVIGYVFFLTFFPLWMFSLLSPVLFVYSLFKGSFSFPIFFMLLTAYTYTPVLMNNRRSPIFRLFLFLNVPKYFKSASFRVVSPDKFPEYKYLKDTLVSTQGGAWHIVNITRVLKNLQVPCRAWLFHPHGLLGSGWGVQAFNPYIHNNEMCISTALYYTPPVIGYTSHCGKPSPVTASVIKAHFKGRKNMSLILGGFEEAAIHPNAGDRIFIKRRKGLFKYALQFSPCELVPVFVFGETQGFTNVQGFWKPRIWLASKGIPAMIPWGRGLLGYLPRNEMLHIVVGDPIEVKEDVGAAVTRDRIDALQAKYIDAVQTLYDEWKTRFYGEDYTASLEIW
eukprot:Blabericola_migrator_1__38@NODE_100_length_14362_cov_139_136341_g85_i1_p6_GENE_NODE_100_length_14362_cov_139_136341_g85_i1NODE_100_length_14362_cov_139_136341_g85_i1_p6_ORF_typecomplete_len445_score62_85DAGAT/PF03982_13/4_3e32_NODE_100_length_14362_cov_139_136341_g85_i11078912123